MAKQLKPILNEVFGADVDFDNTFDLFEVLLMLISADQDEWIQVGRFAWRGQNSGHGSVYARLIKDVQTQATRHPILQCGLFDGKLDRFNAAVDKVTTPVQHVAF